MVNALWLAERVGLPFRFHWRPARFESPERCVPPAAAVFDPDFLAASHRPLAQFRTGLRAVKTSLSRSEIAEAVRDPRRRGVVIDHVGPGLQLDDVAAAPAELRAAWNRIGWNRRLLDLETRARESVPSRSTALHVRRGDIVYGKLRRKHWPAKFRPFAWLRRAAEDLCAGGETVVVFGDSPATVEKLCAGLPVLRADRLRPADASGFEAAFFELCALAATDRIVGSESVYARVAAMIGGTAMELVERRIPSDRQTALVIEDLASHPDHYDRFERVQEVLWLCLNRLGDLTADEAVAGLEEARRLDPDNDLPAVVLAQIRLRSGDHEAAERLFADAAELAFRVAGRVTETLYPGHDRKWALPGVFAARSAAERGRFPYTDAYALELAGPHEPDPVEGTGRSLRAVPGSDFLLARHARALAGAGAADTALALVEERLGRPDVPVVLRTLRASLRRLVRAGARGTGASLPAAKAHESALRDLIARLRPVPTGGAWVRIGPAHDGGYVMPDDLDGLAAVVSPGVGREVGFDEAMARRGLVVIMADGSVAGPPVAHERFRFVPKYVGPRDDATTIRLETLVRHVPDDGDLILQMDIEGGEYHALLDASPETLARFRLMLIEFHGLDALLDPPASDLPFATFERLLETHVVVHLHPNNAGGIAVRAGIEVPTILEVTLLRRDRVAADSGHPLRIPHPLDADNLPARPTLPLPPIWRSVRQGDDAAPPDAGGPDPAGIS